ncbi:MAG: TspO/MBR family protein [Oscillospiraceae bacterium]|nr:TspO/MBR family protein [Oscillospiraceae bacterium]
MTNTEKATEKNPSGIKQFLISMVIPLAVGGISGFITRGAGQIYESLNLPAFAPPPVVFPIVWTILFGLMGISSYLVYIKENHVSEKKAAAILYFTQLAFNFVWPILFFKGQFYLVSFIWLVILALLVAAMIFAFARISRPAAWLQVPYLLWLIFAGILNYSVYLLNF